jgi:hypothetical protein
MKAGGRKILKFISVMVGTLIAKLWYKVGLWGLSMSVPAFVFQFSKP